MFPYLNILIFKVEGALNKESEVIDSLIKLGFN